MRFLIVFLLAWIAVAMSGCEARYRYHCQNPKHWEDKDCNHPDCEATQTCTDYLIHKEKQQ